MFQDSVPAGSYNDPFLSSVCVCVNHLHRCKTSFGCSCFSCFYIMFAGGAGVTLVPAPTKTARSHSDIKGRRPFDVPASNFMFHFNFLQWDVANPRTTMPVFSCIRTFLRTSIVTGFNPLYGFRNLIYC